MYCFCLVVFWLLMLLKALAYVQNYYLVKNKTKHFTRIEFKDLVILHLNENLRTIMGLYYYLLDNL